MSPVSLDFQDRFISLLNNRDGSRDRGFVVFVHGSTDLAPVEEMCFSPEQTYNHCLTVRYGAGPGDILTPLIQTFVEDAGSIPGLTSSKARSKMQSQSRENVSVPLTMTGHFRPSPPEGNWSRVLAIIEERLRKDLPDITVDEFFSLIQRGLDTGDRLVFFCELSDLPPDVTLEDLGFGDERVKFILSHLPKRVGLVFSGVPEDLVFPGLERDRFLDITVGSDYGARGRSPERSQPLKNDSPRGEDRLAITSEVNALADAIMEKDMDPPLVLGILGGWGSGKSFILQLLQERLRFLRNQDLSNDEVRRSTPYVGHPYLVRFDAWTYAKSDLWASLMERILSDLDQQLNLEQVIAPLYQIRKGFDLWEIIANATVDQLDALEEELGREAVARIKDWKQGGGTAKALWDALESLRGEELKKLHDAEAELQKRQRETAESLQKAQIDAEQELLQSRQIVENKIARRQQQHQSTLAQKKAELAAAQARITAEVDREIDKTARHDAWMPLRAEVESFFGAAVDQLLAESGVETEEGPVSVWMVEKEIGLAKKYTTGLRKSSASLAFLIFAIVSGLFTWVLVQEHMASIISSLAGYTGLVGGLLASGYTALTRVNRWFEEKQAIYEERMEAARGERLSMRESMLADRRQEVLVPREAEIEDLQNRFAIAIKALEEQEQEGLKNQRVQVEKNLQEMKSRSEIEIQALNQTVEEHRRRAGIPGQSKSLTELIQKRIESGYYQERLGILHQVQKDLQEITDALLPVRGYNETLFPRGAPRIILLIDDLDRCPPDKVVQVLEAAQLLVKTRLFVVVIAMDVRFVTRALEKEYAGILTHVGNPSGLDYTEKIVQIPYRVRPIAPEAMTSYLTSQMAIRQETGPASFAPGGADGHLPPATITAPDRASTRVNDALPPEIQEFEPSELELLKNAAISVEITPRATKRLVNVMKLIKNIWYRKSLSVPSYQVEQAMVLLLTLSASYPETMARILDELERGYRDLVKSSPSRTLYTALQSIIERWCGQEGIAEDWSTVTRLIENIDLLDPNLTLDELRLDNLQIVRSFSFLGEVDMPQIEKTSRHTVELTPPGSNPGEMKQWER